MTRPPRTPSFRITRRQGLVGAAASIFALTAGRALAQAPLEPAALKARAARLRAY